MSRKVPIRARGPEATNANANALDFSLRHQGSGNLRRAFVVERIPKDGYDFLLFVA